MKPVYRLLRKGKVLLVSDEVFIVQQWGRTKLPGCTVRECTYLCVSGLHWNTRRPERAQQTEEALAFFRLLLWAPIERIAIENPVGCISTLICKPDCIVQPWQFGHPESKKTCLWLKNLPALRPTNVLPLPPSGRWSNQTASGQNKLAPSADRWKLRSKTYQGIANTMADQWGAP